MYSQIERVHGARERLVRWWREEMIDAARARAQVSLADGREDEPGVEIRRSKGALRRTDEHRGDNTRA